MKSLQYMHSTESKIQFLDIQWVVSTPSIFEVEKAENMAVSIAGHAQSKHKRSLTKEKWKQSPFLSNSSENLIWAECKLREIRPTWYDGRGRKTGDQEFSNLATASDFGLCTDDDKVPTLSVFVLSDWIKEVAIHNPLPPDIAHKEKLIMKFVFFIFSLYDLNNFFLKFSRYSPR